MATRAAAKQRAPTIIATFSLEKLRADIKLGPGHKKKGARHYTVNDLVNLKEAKGAGASMQPIDVLQERVLKLYTSS